MVTAMWEFQWAIYLRQGVRACAKGPSPRLKLRHIGGVSPGFANLRLCGRVAHKDGRTLK